MSQPDFCTIRKPRTDDRPLWDLQFGIWGYTALLVAHDLKLFPLLAEKPRTLAEVCEALNIARRPAEALLTLCVHGVGARPRRPLCAHSPGGRVSARQQPHVLRRGARLQYRHPLSFADLKKAVLTNTPQCMAAAIGSRRMKSKPRCPCLHPGDA